MPEMSAGLGLAIMTQELMTQAESVSISHVAVDVRVQRGILEHCEVRRSYFVVPVEQKS